MLSSIVVPRSLATFVLLAMALPAAAQPPPDCTITGPALACGAAELCGPEGDFDYRWFGPDGAMIGAARCLVTPVGGRYQLIVVDRATGARSERCEHVVRVEECDSNHAPDCSAATPSVERLWNEGNEFQPVSVLGLTDSDGDPVSIRIVAVTHDEPARHGEKDKDCPAARRIPGGVELLARRDGGGNGRVYEIRFVACDERGGECEGRVRVCVPHDRAREECIDDGQRVNALEDCGTSR